MALIICDECSNEISDKANACPKCGNPIQHFKNDKTKVCEECTKLAPINSESCPSCGNPFNLRKKSGTAIRNTKLLILKIFSIKFITVAVVVFLATYIFINRSSLNRTEKTSHETEILQPIKSPEQIKGEEYVNRIESAINITNPVTRKFYLNLASKFPGNYNIDQISSIYSHIRGNWKYVNDPNGGDYFSPSNETIENDLTGDCDDFAILLASCIQGIGGEVRINLAFNNESGHAYTEVKIADSKTEMDAILKNLNNHYNGIFDYLFGNNQVKEIHYRTDPDGSCWLNLDWSGEYPGGPYFEHKRIWVVHPLEKTFSYASDN